MFAIIAASVITAVALAILILLLTFAVYQASHTRIGYIPLPARALPAVVKALGIGKREVAQFFDLGCGDGRILQAVVTAHPNVSGVGIEFHPMVVWLARWRLRRLSTAHIKILRGDILRQDLSAANYLFTYLNHDTMALLEPKLHRELRPGARLISCDFPLPTKKAAKTVKIGVPWQLGQTLYIYEY